MTQAEKNNRKLIQQAIKKFPGVVKQKELAYKEQEKVIKAFMPMAKELQRRVKKDKKAAKRRST
jgi:hypothetical protein